MNYYFLNIDKGSELVVLRGLIKWFEYFILYRYYVVFEGVLWSWWVL